MGNPRPDHLCACVCIDIHTQKQIKLLKLTDVNRNPKPSKPIFVIDLSRSDSDSEDSSSSSDDDDSVLGVNDKRSRVSSGVFFKKKKRIGDLGVALPLGFLDPLPPKNSSLPLPMLPSVASKPQSAPVLNASVNGNGNLSANVEKCKQFWKAGDYEGESRRVWDTSLGSFCC